MNRLTSPAKPSKDAVDTIHLFVSDPEDLERRLPEALTHLGAQTNLVVVFNHRGFMSNSRDAITNAMTARGFRASAMISMKDPWGAVHYRKRS